MFVHAKKDELKIFANKCSIQQGWTKEACYVNGNLYSILQKHDIALAWFKRALIIDPRYDSALVLLGNEYLELKSPNEAILAYAKAASIFLVL